VGRQENPLRVIIVTGASGSGRASALRVLEDLGFYCVDNLPVALAPAALRLVAERGGASVAGLGLGVDARERMFFPQWPQVFEGLEQAGSRPLVLFLDASAEVLARRYSESRRPHPLADGPLGVAEAIKREREALAGLFKRADHVLDTTTLTIHELRDVIIDIVRAGRQGPQMLVTLASFGYKYGMPVGLDLVFDARFLPNPFFVPELRDLTGLDPKVGEFVLARPEAERFVDALVELLAFLLPLYQKEGKSYLTIGLGCTGGRHRSPALVLRLKQRLEEKGFAVAVRHHHIDRQLEDG
jgi:UPF0042 nucleotide-binding protein